MESQPTPIGNGQMTGTLAMTGNPFLPYASQSQWTSNELILKDPSLRRLARIGNLDQKVSEHYAVQPQKNLL